jgi:hypothetical protein
MEMLIPLFRSSVITHSMVSKSAILFFPNGVRPELKPAFLTIQGRKDSILGVYTFHPGKD